MRRPAVYVEHGSGQNYQGHPDPSYSGGPNHEHVRLFLSPNRTVAHRWRGRYPHTPAVAVGCPRLDYMVGLHRPQPRPVVAISFHSHVPLCMETTSAFDFYDPHLTAFVGRLRQHDVEVVGHAHPRIWTRIAPRWEQLGVRPVSFAEVLIRASVYCVDNSSTGFEFMATGRPVVWLNQPAYRRSIEHGLRFWEMSDGAAHCDDPKDLADIVLGELADPDRLKARRDEITARVYAHLGDATRRAVEAIVALAEQRNPTTAAV